jgi:homogentisate 1,2-dioxygenase
MKQGVSYYAYSAGKDMANNEAFYSADGDFCIGQFGNYGTVSALD